MTSQPLRLEVGKYYRTRDGEVVGPMQIDLYSRTSFPYFALFDGSLSVWTEDGAFTRFTTSSFDLVEEVPAPAAAPEKPAIKVKTTKTAKLTETQIGNAIRAYVGASVDVAMTIVINEKDRSAVVTWTVEDGQ